jgi:hypothetical protein
MILRREDVAARPANVRAQANQRLMCSEPVTRTPASGLPAAYLLRIETRPGISCSAMLISFRPQSASDMSATL